MDNLDGTYAYVLILGKEVVLCKSTEPHSFSPLTTTVLENATVKIGQNGLVDIQGDEIIYDFYSTRDGYRIFESDWEHEPHASEIHQGRRWWKALLHIGETERFVYCGFVRRNETKKSHIILSQFIIKRH